MGDVVDMEEINAALMRFVCWGRKAKTWTTGLRQNQVLPSPHKRQQENEF